MSKLMTNRLWNARFRKNKNIIVPRIEAPTAAEAVAEVTQMTKNMNELLTMLESEPIYETSIGVELDDGDSKSENGIFEITVKGTDNMKVDELKKLLALIVNGIPCNFEYPDEKNVPQSIWVQRLCHFINENAMMVVSL